jgi:hypothetical protein
VSYDYFLFAKPIDGREATLEALAAAPRSIGTPADLMARIDALFPSVRWEMQSGEAAAWFGVKGPPEFLLMPDADGNVSVLKAAYIELDEIRRLATALSLIAFDPQKACFVGD